MWKTVLGSLHTTKAVAELERLGIATKEVVNGTEQWKKAQDVILDLAIRMRGSSEDFSQSLQKMSRGVMQYAKLAASLNVGDILLGESASINSNNSTDKLLGIQMDTIARKAAQVKTSLLDMFNGVGEGGGRSFIKGALDEIDSFILGVNKLSGVLTPLVLSIGGLTLAYKLLYAPIASAITAQNTLTVAEEANIIAKKAQTAALAVNDVAQTIATTATVAQTEANFALAASEATAATGLAWMTAGLSLIVPAIIGLVMWLGHSKKAEEDLAQKRLDNIAIQEKQMSQIDRQITFLNTLVSTHNKLTKTYDDLVKSGKTDIDTVEKQKTIRQDLDKISKALTQTLTLQGAKEVETANWSVAAINKQVEALKSAKAVADGIRVKLLSEQQSDADSALAKKNSEISAKQAQIAELDKYANEPKDYNPFSAKSGNQAGASDKSAKLKAELETAKTEQQKLALDAADLKTKVEGIKLDQLNGVASKDAESQAQDNSNFDEDMKVFQHGVNQHLKGYEDATAQVIKLKEIKANFEKTMIDPDKIETIKDDIYKLENPNVSSTAVSSDIKMSAADTKRDMNSYARSNRDLDGQLVKSDATLSKFKDTTKAYREELVKQIPIYKAKQDLAHQEAEDLRAEDAALMHRINTEKLSVSDRNALLNQLDSNQTKVSNLQKSWLDYDKTLSDISNKNSLSLVNEAIDKSADSTKVFDDKIKALKTSMDSLKANPADWSADETSLLKLYKDKSDSLISSNKELETLSKNLDKNSDAYSKNKDQIDKNKASIEQITADIESENHKIIKSEEDLAKRYEESLKKTDDYNLKQHQIASQHRVDGLQVQIDSLADANQLSDDNAEKAKKQSDLAKLNTTLYLYQNNTLANISDEMAKQLDLVQAKADAIQRQNDLIKAQTDLTTAQNEKNVKLFKDGSFQWVANPKTVQTAQDNLDKLVDANDKQKLTNVDNFNKQIITKTDELNKFVTDMNRKAQKEQLQDQIKSEQASIKKEEEAVNKKWANIELTTTTELTNLRKIYGDNWKLIIDDLTVKANEAEAQYARIAGTSVSVGGGSGGGGGSSSSGVVDPTKASGGGSSSSPSSGGFNPPSGASGSQASSQSQILSEMNANSSSWLFANDSEKAALSAKNDQLRQDLSYVGGHAVAVDGKWQLQSFDTGGFTGDNEGIAKLHKKELVLNALDSSKILEAVKTVRTMPDLSSIVKMPDFSSIINKFTSKSGSNDTHFHIANVSVKANSAQEFIKNLTLSVNKV